MKARLHRLSVWMVLSCFLVAGLCGCGKRKQKMKMPDIKMITSEYVLSIAAPDDQNIWIVGAFGMIYHSVDGGETWTEQQSGVDLLLSDVEFKDAQNGWVSGIRGTMLNTTNGGQTWTKQDSGTRNQLLDVCFVDREYGWAIGDFTTIIHTTDGGRTWQPQSESQDRIYNKVFFIDREWGWVAGEEGTLLRTTDGGANWVPVEPEYFKRESLEQEYENPRPTLFGIYFTDRNNGWLCGLDSVIMHTTDGGQTWKVINEGQDILFNIFIKAGRGWAVGNQGVYLLSRDGGKTWQKMEKAIKSKLSFSNVFFSSPQKGWVVGAAGTVVKTLDGGETWTFRSGLSYEFEGFKMPEALEKRIIE